MADFDAYVKCQERVSEVFQVSFKLKCEPLKLTVVIGLNPGVSDVRLCDRPGESGSEKNCCYTQVVETSVTNNSSFQNYPFYPISENTERP